MTNGAPPPAVSVVMSVYNGEEHLEKAIQSILDQTFTDFEFIIINDGSTDGTKQLVERMADSDDRIVLVDQKNTGLTQALCNGVNTARAPLIARMDADDISTPDRFARQVEVMRSRPDCVAATCFIEHFFDDGTVRGVANHIGPEPLIPLYNVFSNRIGGHGQVMFRKSAYDAAGGYDPAFRYSQDYDLWARLLEHGSFALIEDVLYRWRVGHGSVTDKNKSAQLDCALEISMREYQKLAGLPIAKATAQAFIDFWWARKPEGTPMRDTLRATKAMDRAITAFFEKQPELREMESGVRRTISSTWRWRIPLAGKLNLARRALLLGHAIYWRLSA